MAGGNTTCHNGQMNNVHQRRKVMADDNAIIIGAGCGGLSVGAQPVCVIPYQEHDGLYYTRGGMIAIPRWRSDDDRRGYHRVRLDREI
jgi:hypothetical protein